MAWSTADIPDQSGRVAVVTGANGGLGLETGWPVESLIAHPGLSDTDLQATSVETSDGEGGEFHGPRWMNAGNPVKLPILRRVGMAGAIATLRSVSEALTGERILPE